MSVVDIRVSCTETCHTAHTERLEHQLNRLERIMADINTAADDVIAEFATLIGELKTALGLAGIANPAVQAVADRMEAAVAAVKAEDTTIEPAPPVDTPPVDVPPADVPPVVDPTPAPVDVPPFP